jgi:hypothetical protein
VSVAHAPTVLHRALFVEREEERVELVNAVRERKAIECHANVACHMPKSRYGMLTPERPVL